MMVVGVTGAAFAQPTPCEAPLAERAFDANVVALELLDLASRRVDAIEVGYFLAEDVAAPVTSVSLPISRLVPAGRNCYEATLPAAVPSQARIARAREVRDVNGVIEFGAWSDPSNPLAPLGALAQPAAPRLRKQ
jgi:hypothetical protein